MANGDSSLRLTSSLAALADPTRRAVLERLAGGPLPVGRIAETLPVSRPAVSQHLKVLKAAGLVIDAADGNRRVYRIDPQGLGPIHRWLDGFPDEAIGSFAAAFEPHQEDPT
ncbi:ArsR/SmtB family transcription factor [Chthonobacter rhizosphaerae]|uniref:ArsR/SmtB family transcription factor n=1 Tax=Chthonobacter rhizosphaerae TaxID=2735553 RepID=UPI0015EE8977|nr:metalloregulator ArsR/SmtB family transcription factor [Chthonobacter rhizosphaerae]